MTVGDEDEASEVAPGLTTTASLGIPGEAGPARRRQPRWCLVVAWSEEEPSRVGEVAELPAGKRFVLGRDGTWHDGAMPVLFAPRRRHALAPGRPMRGKAISRRQLELGTTQDGLEVSRIGRCAMRIGGHDVERGTLTSGRCLTLAGQLVLLAVRRPEVPSSDDEGHPYGGPDGLGIVGESPVAWRLREQLRFLAGSDEHVLLCGASGTGKELAARALHTLSSRRERPLVSRNAATLPAGLIDCELFGNVADYPNPGTPARDGLVGSADGSTLFLDEIGELPSELQAHLLRVLDADGEFQRLGEDVVRRSRFRLVAATNREPDALKHDLLARLPLRLELPGLDERREDIPLMIHHLLTKAAEGTPEVAARFFDAAGRPRLAPELVVALVEHRYALHVRELATLLWQAITESDGAVMTLTPGLGLQLHPPPHRKDGPEPAAIATALADHDGNVTRAAAALNLSRHALNRLLKKHGIAPSDHRG